MRTSQEVMVRRVGEQFFVEPLVNDVAEIGHRNVLVDAGGILWSDMVVSLGATADVDRKICRCANQL